MCRCYTCLPSGSLEFWDTLVKDAHVTTPKQKTRKGVSSNFLRQKHPPHSLLHFHCWGKNMLSVTPLWGGQHKEATRGFYQVSLVFSHPVWLGTLCIKSVGQL